MSVRKFLDDTGAQQLNQILAAKFNTKADASSVPTKTSDLTNDSNFLQATPLTSPVRIWELNDGLYKLPSGCVVYYKGATDTTSITISTTGYMFITKYSTTYKNWFILCGNTSTTRYLYNGYTTSSTGATKALNIGSSYLTSISSYVKNELTYSTSNTTYALSAYQGYVLNQNKADKTELPTKTSDLTNDSNFPVDASYVHTDNNFSTTLKNKLDAIAEGAQVNVIETIKVNNSALTPDANKAVNITVPTKTSDLTNDSGYGDVSTKQNKATYSTTDLTPGTSTLATGDIYLVYE